MPLVPVPLGKPNKDKLVYYRIRTDSTDPDSLTYQKCIRYFETGDPEHWVKTLQDIDEIWSQNDIGDGPTRYNIVKLILDGAAWTAFESKVDLAGIVQAGNNVDMAEVDEGLESVGKKCSLSER